jgi:hypothetical protein
MNGTFTVDRSSQTCRITAAPSAAPRAEDTSHTAPHVSPRRHTAARSDSAGHEIPRPLSGSSQPIFLGRKLRLTISTVRSIQPTTQNPSPGRKLNDGSFLAVGSSVSTECLSACRIVRQSTRIVCCLVSSVSDVCGRRSSRSQSSAWRTSYCPMQLNTNPPE